MYIVCAKVLARVMENALPEGVTITTRQVSWDESLEMAENGSVAYIESGDYLFQSTFRHRFHMMGPGYHPGLVVKNGPWPNEPLFDGDMLLLVRGKSACGTKMLDSTLMTFNF